MTDNKICKCPIEERIPTYPGHLKEPARKKREENMQSTSDMKNPIESLSIHKELRIMDKKITELGSVVELLGDKLVFVFSNRPVPSDIASMLYYLHRYNERIKFIIKQVEFYMSRLEM